MSQALKPASTCPSHSFIMIHCLVLTAKIISIKKLTNKVKNKNLVHVIVEFLVVVPWSIIFKKIINGSYVLHVSLMPYLLHF